MGPAIARTVLLATTALPVVGLTVLAAMLRLVGVPPGGPLAPASSPSSARSGPDLVPLLLTIVGLVGFAVRERSAGYAFSAGLVLELAVTLGYALAISTAGRPFDVVLPRHAPATGDHHGRGLGHRLAARAALARRVAREWHCDTCTGVCSAHSNAGGPSTMLMNVQLGMAAAGNLAAAGLGAAAAGLCCRLASGLEHRGGPAAGLDRPGAAAGGLAIPRAAAAATGRAVRHGRAGPAGLHGPRAGVALAATTSIPIWGYRTLMLGWAVYALLVVLATWWVASLRTLPGAAGPPQGLIRMAAVWVRAAGILAVLLGLKAAFWPIDRSSRANFGRPRPSPWPACAGADHGRLAAPRGLGLLGRAGGQPGRLAGRLALPVSQHSLRGVVAAAGRRPTSSPARPSPWPGWRHGDASISSATSRSARARCWPSRSRCRRPAIWSLLALPVGWLVDARPGCRIGTTGWPRRRLDRPPVGRRRRRLVRPPHALRPPAARAGLPAVGRGRAGRLSGRAVPAADDSWLAYHVLTAAWAVGGAGPVGLAILVREKAEQGGKGNRNLFFPWVTGHRHGGRRPGTGPFARRSLAALVVGPASWWPPAWPPA